jgi:AcrR family transcriptional regulator
MGNMPRPTRVPAKSRRSYHHGNLRRALLDEVLATVRAEGVEGVTLRDIGARLGVSRTALYRHFTDKRALLAAVATEGFRMLREQLGAAWEEGGRGDTAFRAMGEAYVRFAADNPSHYRVMFGGFVDALAKEPELATEARGAFQVLVDAVAALQHDGVLVGDDALIMARYNWALVHGIAMLAIDGQLPGPTGVEELMRYSFERLRTGILVDTGTHRASRARN